MQDDMFFKTELRGKINERISSIIYKEKKNAVDVQFAMRFVRKRQSVW